MQQNGFIDLRQHGQSQGAHSDDSVWPSFTDIMTVVVMIFLLALVVVLVRNNELVDQLKLTVQAERLASEQVRATAEQKLTLEGRLGNLQGRVVDLTSTLNQSQAARDRGARTLEEKIQEIEKLIAEVGGLNDVRNRLQTETANLQSAKDQLQQDKAALENEKTTLEQTRDQLNTELEALRGRVVTVESERTDLSAERERLSRALSALQSRFGNLETDRGSVEAERSRLANALQSLEERFGKLELDREAVVADNTQLDQKLDALNARLAASQTEIEGVSKARDTAIAQNRDLGIEIESQRDESAAARARLAAQLQILSRQLDSLGAERTSLQTSLAARDKELTSARSDAATAMRSLKGDYDDLELRYNKLVRPARSPDGKTVVNIRHFKRSGQLVIEYRGVGGSTFEPINRAELDQRLGALKTKHPTSLYTRIIFPENSGLSYNEAFDFESSILKKYDYYSQ